MSGADLAATTASASEPERPVAPESLAQRRREWLLLFLAAIVGGALFFPSLGKLWPLIPGDLHRSPAALASDAARFLATEGVDVRGYQSASELSVPGDEGPDALSYIERAFGRERARTLIADGLPVAPYSVVFKRYDNPNAVVVWLLPDGRAAGWRRDLQEDDPPPGEAAPSKSEADLPAAVAALDRLVGADASLWKQTGMSNRQLPARFDSLYTFERIRSLRPELKERMQIRVTAGRTLAVIHTIVVPASADRDVRRREAPRRLLDGIGAALFGIAVLGAFTVFVLRLRDGTAPLARATVWSALVFVLGLTASLLRPAEAFLEWDTLQPRGVGLLTYIVRLVQGSVWTFAVLVAVIAAGDALDVDSGRNRGATLWKLTRGHLLDPAVGAASLRGFLLGCVGGGLLAGTVLLLTQFAGAGVSLQPRGFFSFALNSPLPGLSTLFYFLQVALLEELGYRYFAGAWLLSVLRRRWRSEGGTRFVAIFLPALVYGLTHTSLTFLPPDQPFWARAFVMTLVGCLWGWAFLRWDALTVVTSHFTADLFIFNWPRLASGDPHVVASAALTILLPVLPALGLIGRLFRIPKTAGRG